MPTELTDVEDFLGHSGRSRGGSILENWKDKDKGGLGFKDVWFSRRAPVAVAIWRHSFLRYDVVEDERTRQPVRVIKYATLLCPEAEDVIKMQGRRSRQSGELLAPYQVCPMHKFLEWLYQMVSQGQLHWLAEVLRFDVGDGKPRVFHASGLYGGITDDIGPDAEREMNRYGVYLKTAFKEKWMAQLNYVFRVVDNDHPAEGIQIAVEPASVGDHTKMEIRKAMHPKALGKERGNPIRNPYCIEWAHHPEEKEPNKRYSAQRLEIPLSPEIDKIITDTEPPDIDGLLAPPVWLSVRSTLEKAWQVPDFVPPWDDFFGKVPATEDDKKLAQQRLMGPQAAAAMIGRVVGTGGPPPEVGRNVPPQPPPARRPPAGPPPLPRQAQLPAMEDVPRFVCETEGCGNVLLITETFCAKCERRYEDPAEPEAPAAERPMTRAEALAAARSAGGQARAPAAAPAGAPPAPPAAPRAVPPTRPVTTAVRPQGPAGAPRRPPAQAAPEFDDFPFGANEPVQDLPPADSLPWGK
jgi:hypothetical protein